MFSKLVWGLKQLLPLSYESNYRAKDGKFHSEWRMWFGKPFHISYVKVE